MDRLDSGICVSILRKEPGSITMSIYGVQKDSDIDAIKDNIRKIAQNLTGQSDPKIHISLGYTNIETDLESLTMKDLV